MTETAPLPLLERFSRIIAALQRALIARERSPSIAPEIKSLPVPLIMLAWSRIGRIRQRFMALAQTIVDGTYRPRPARQHAATARCAEPPQDDATASDSAARASDDAGTVRNQPAAVAKRPREMRGFGWMVRMGLWDAAAISNHMRLLLSEPEMQALIATSPQLLRILRSLCWGLGIEASVLPPPAPRPNALLTVELPPINPLDPRTFRPTTGQLAFAGEARDAWPARQVQASADTGRTEPDWDQAAFSAA